MNVKEMKSFLRYLKRNPYYSVINILGLSVALMFVITIGDYTWRQLSTDSYHHDSDRIYLLGDDERFFSWPDVAGQIAEMLPDIECSCSFVSTSGNIFSDFEENRIYGESSILLVDPSFTEMFDFPFVKGIPEAALSSPDRCIITESTADQLFPGVDPIGRAIRLEGMHPVQVNDGGPDPYDKNLLYKVSAVIKDFDRTVLPCATKVIISIQRYPQVLGVRMSKHFLITTQSGNCRTFFRIREGADTEEVAHAVGEYFKEHVPVLATMGKNDFRARLTPLRKVMLAPQNDHGGLERGDRRLMLMLLLSIFVILIFAVTNYVNLTVAAMGMRAKEIATGRLLGMSRISASCKLVLESIMMVLVAFLIGLCLSFAFQDWFAALFRGRISLQKDVSVGSVAICVAFIVITGLLAGLIPGIQINSINPVAVVKGSFRYKSKKVFSRVFIIVQTVASVVMLTLSIVVTLQIKGLVNAPLGVNSEDLVLVVPYSYDDQHVREVLEKLPCVERTGTFSQTCPLGFILVQEMIYNVDKRNYMLYTSIMDRDAFDIFGLKLLRDDGSSGKKVYFTETFMNNMDVDFDASVIEYDGEHSEMVSGVVGDFHMGSILKDVVPARITVAENAESVKEIIPSTLNFIVKTDGSKEAFTSIQNAVNEALDNNYPPPMVVDIEASVRDYYKEQRNTMHIIYMFTGIAVLLSILGFIGLSVFFIRQWRSEIAVRRVFGGRTGQVVVHVLVRFCTPLLVSFVFAVPLAFWVAKLWLSGFSWRIQLSPWIFIAACASSLLVAVLSILFQTISAVDRNPSEAIKSE